jgi:serine/threonine protein kinase
MSASQRQLGGRQVKVTLFPCGPAANESELKGFEHLKNRMQSEPGNYEWVLLTNLAFSVTHQLQSDEIDVAVVGPMGVRVIEIKHWTPQWCEAHEAEIEHAADRLTNKARKVGTTLRRLEPQLPRVDGSILLTQEPSKVRRVADQKVRGVGFHTLSDWKAAIGFDAPKVLSAQQVRRLALALQPRTAVAIDGSLTRLAGYVNLELQTSPDQRFHRIYKGNHPARRDRVVLHLYDLSAVEDKNAEAKAKREFEALHQLQLYPWAPRILDSYQDAPGYEGEMFYFTVVDPAAPCIEDRTSDTTWTPKSRIAFARTAVLALAELHAAGTKDEHIIHRNLTTRTILVKHDNSAILTGFERAKIPAEPTVASTSLSNLRQLSMIAPEVRAQGLAAADSRSDVYSLCACLSQLFKDSSDDVSRQATELFADGLIEDPGNRIILNVLEASLSTLLGESVLRAAPPPARFWTEDQIIRFRERDYRILSRLGSGGVGTTFKVIEIDRSTGKDLGTYVAKVVHESDVGRRVLKAYSTVRPHLRHSALSTIFEVATDWQENEFVALMTWISGAPLAEFAGVFPLLAEEQQETTEGLALRWLRDICQGLHVLHRNGLIHGDVSPRNLIVSGNDLVLTDYDFAGRIDQSLAAPGTVLYCSPSYQDRIPASNSDDIYALAASFFYVIFDKEPFRYGGDLDKKRGLNWEGVNREQCPILSDFLEKATHPSPELRFRSMAEELSALGIQERTKAPQSEEKMPLKQSEVASNLVRSDEGDSEMALRPQRVDWLLTLLQSYPGSRWGNRETRGLDTAFAAQTYVETDLEKTLEKDIRERQVRLVILCGNAGDGKTALLQRLASKLGLGDHRSSERVLEGKIPNGPLVRMNLDGSASLRGRSADVILEDFLAPFQNGSPEEDIVHLLAINDGRLLEWIEGVEARQAGSETALTAALYGLLQQEVTTHHSHIRFISLNQRSLVGGITRDGSHIDTRFLERLTYKLYGGQEAAKIWAPCRSCSAKEHCQVFRAASLFGSDAPGHAAEPAFRLRARQRLFEAFQAVHLRGEVHITVREVRAALVYILFGTNFCEDYHTESGGGSLPYWDRAFSPDSPGRQGELLGELSRFDPSLEAHPQIDRHLVATPAADSVEIAPQYPDLSLESARRRAYFEWTLENIEEVTGDGYALDLARGRHLRLFRDLPLANERELTELCERLCKGISRLEDLPPQALDRPGVVPLRVTPRTPTETAFWVEKPIGAFRLEANISPAGEETERLHREAFLIYRYRFERGEERLRMGAELFHLLLELAEGYQLGDVSTDDTFAHLSIFVQRLVREDERELLAWNPIQDEAIYHISTAAQTTGGTLQQQMTITSIDPGVHL